VLSVNCIAIATTSSHVSMVGSVGTKRPMSKALLSALIERAGRKQSPTRFDLRRPSTLCGGRSHTGSKEMVPEAGLEPARLAAQVFETCASADSATPAQRGRRTLEGLARRINN
jgi:hypothetical protein